MDREKRKAAKRPPSLGESQVRILHLLKRRGALSIPELAGVLDLSVETVRAHLRTLSGEGFVGRVGTRGDGPGRPVQLFGLTGEAEILFPDRSGEVLLSLIKFLEEGGGSILVRRFFHETAEDRRERALSRVGGLDGTARLKEVAVILTEEGFMAEVETPPGSAPRLRVCHCPIRPLIALTREPCRAELNLVRDLLGSEVSRVSYIPSGGSACSYGLK